MPMSTADAATLATYATSICPSRWSVAVEYPVSINPLERFTIVVPTSASVAAIIDVITAFSFTGGILPFLAKNGSDRLRSKGSLTALA